MTEHTIPPQKYEAIILASNKRELIPIVMGLLGLSLDNIYFIDPEKPSLEAEFRMEPESEDPFEAVKFKLNRILELFQSTEKENQELVLYASDVVFSANGEHFLKPSRSGEDIDIETIHQELLERYKQPFLAEWNVAFGVADKQGVNMGNIRIEADYPSLTAEDISGHFLPSSNAGLELIEIGIAKGLSFKLFLDAEEEPMIVDSQEGYNLIYQFVVQKLPTEEMFNSLVERDLDEHPDRYGLVAQSFLTLRGYYVQWQEDILIEISPASGSGSSFMS
ncbi:MAG: hypothetical protein HN981_04020 [Candidatus Pacebacteria bacterium]|nr:hypothetical protein [Candidatus Paceibacterota bacterium]MBT4652414.1 hypothetical protein [Candidatus Paceibacterota bacterium]MBT6756241.1 hypothetical protein [Candidatus Paceibacterota bacterium]MBT6921532.1 hypothetical protein [Candidatus Paceibacterota bacterium]